MFQDYDKVRHGRFLKLMASCWFIMAVFWGCAWYVDWLSALFSLLANVYFVFGIFWWFQLYPQKRE